VASALTPIDVPMLERVEDFFRHPGPDAPKVDQWRAVRRAHATCLVVGVFISVLVLAYGAPTLIWIMVGFTLAYSLAMTAVFTVLLNRERNR
jgi:hypothetical protein